MNALFPDLVVNGETVPSARIAAETQNHDGPRGKPGIPWRKAANAIAVRTLLLQEARKRGIEARVQEVGPGRFETEEEALVRGLLEEAVVASPPSAAAVDPTQSNATMHAASYSPASESSAYSTPIRPSWNSPR